MSHVSQFLNRPSVKRALCLFTASGVMLGVTACRLPALRAPDSATELPTTFNGSTNTENSAVLSIEEFFNDPKLTGLVAQATTGNQELKILNEDIQIANYEVFSRRGSYLPAVSLGAGAGFEKSSRYTREGAVEDALTVAPDHAFPNPLPSFLLAANFTWQVDIWRQFRNARDSATLRYLGTAEGRNYTYTRLAAEIAEKYYELLALDQRLETLNNTIKLQEQSVEISKVRKDAARGNELPVQRFQAEVQKNQSEKFIVLQDIVEAENRINFLLGRYPQPVERPGGDFVELNLQALSLGVPAQLLQNRPDIRQAERELGATGLDVKVAQARFYPSLTIDSRIGYSAFSPRYLFTTPDAILANLAGSLAAPLINRNAIEAEYLTANARQLQAVYNYQRVVLNAFTEVVNRVSMVENYRKSIELKKEQLKTLKAAVENSTKLFQNARAEYIEVLTAQRDLMEARMSIIDIKRKQLTAIVSTYQALGGGVILNPPAPTPAAPVGPPIRPPLPPDSKPLPAPNQVPAPLSPSAPKPNLLVIPLPR